MNTLVAKSRWEIHQMAVVAAALLAAGAGTATMGQEALPPANANVAEGFALRPVARGLNFPTAIAFDGDRVWVAESGVVPQAQPGIREVHGEGTSSVILHAGMLPGGTLLQPITDITAHDGWLWVAHRQRNEWQFDAGAISRFQPQDPVGTFTTVIADLPSAGDHYTEEIVFDSQGRLYFSQGSASNSGVVGPDNALVTGWLSANMVHPMRDYPPTDVVLSGVSYTTPVPFELDPGAVAVTAPFSRFGSGQLPEGTVVPAATPDDPQRGFIAGNGAVYSLDPNAEDPVSTLRLEAWGIRNGFGMAIDPANPNLLFVSNNGADIRMAMVDGELTVVESRPVANDWDDLFIVTINGSEDFFGWPDWAHHPETREPLLLTDPLFCQVEGLTIPCPELVFAEAFRSGLEVSPAFAQFETHVSVTKFDFATDPAFGGAGDLFVAETGGRVPGGGEFRGFKVVRVNRETGEVSDFISANSGTAEELFLPEGFNKPIDVKFNNGTMYIVDMGVFEPSIGLQMAGSGKIWAVQPRIAVQPGPISGFPIPPEPPTPVTDVKPGADIRRFEFRFNPGQIGGAPAPGEPPVPAEDEVTQGSDPGREPVGPQSLKPKSGGRTIRSR